MLGAKANSFQFVAIEGVFNDDCNKRRFISDVCRTSKDHVSYIDVVSRGLPRSILAGGGLSSYALVCFPFLDLRFLTQAGARPGWLEGKFPHVGSMGRVVRSFADGVEAEIRANPSLAFGSEHGRFRVGHRRPRQNLAADIGNGLSIAG